MKRSDSRLVWFIVAFILFATVAIVIYKMSDGEEEDGFTMELAAPPVEVDQTGE